jgi:type IX secretion system PorP/SprF family membrane protein
MPFYFGGQSRVPRHGMGINLMGDQAGAGVLRKIDANFNYSFLISLGRDYDHNIRLGVSAGIQQASLDFFRLRFPDQFGPDGSQLPTQELFDGGNRIHEEIGAGFVYYNKIFYMGANVRHLTQPQQTFINSNAPNAQLPMHFAAFTGLNIPLNAQKPNGPSISPAFMFRYQQPFTQIDLGLYANLDPIVIGTWYRWDDAVIFLVGLQRGQFSVGYSYDLTVSDLTNAASGGAHEVSVVVTFDGPGRKAKRPTAKMSCPRF